MTTHDPYPTARGVESAIKEAARTAARNDPSLDVGKRIQLEYFNRFLSRVFRDRGDSEWVLKGGTGILARVPSTRSTRDIDLYRRDGTLTEALAELTRLAATDLGDHFHFEYVQHSPSIGDDAQPSTDGYQVTFAIFVGTAQRGTLHVVVGGGITGDVVTCQPQTGLDLPRLVSNPYRLYPVVDQIADKVCATMAQYRGTPSSREKDLVDLVVFAVTQDLAGTGLRTALVTEMGRRGMESFDRFSVPSTWGRGYARLSRPVVHCSGYRTVETAVELVSRLIDPVLVDEVDGRVWSHSSQRWT